MSISVYVWAVPMLMSVYFCSFLYLFLYIFRYSLWLFLYIFRFSLCYYVSVFGCFRMPLSMCSLFSFSHFCAYSGFFLCHFLFLLLISRTHSCIYISYVNICVYLGAFNVYLNFVISHDHISMFNIYVNWATFIF